MLRALGHLLLILAGYVAAAVGASLFISLLFTLPLGWSADELPFVMAGSILVAVPILAAIIAHAAFLPAAVAIAAAEIAGARDWSFHAIAGGAVALVIGAMMDGSTETGHGPGLTYPGLLLVMIAAGIVAGIVYWAVAGRASGQWRRPVSAPPSPGS